MIRGAPALLRAVALLVGALEGLLAARLVLKLFAARPDNPIFNALFALTQPFAASVAYLDAGQPRFGAVLEFSTLVWMLLLLLLLVTLHVAANVWCNTSTVARVQ